MDNLNFADAVAELVRQFPSVDSDDRELAIQKFQGLNVFADRTSPAQDLLSDGIDWFDNFPV